jgi:hypothetical protein
VPWQANKNEPNETTKNDGSIANPPNPMVPAGFETCGETEKAEWNRRDKQQSENNSDSNRIRLLAIQAYPTDQERSEQPHNGGRKYVTHCFTPRNCLIWWLRNDLLAISVGQLHRATKQHTCSLSW